MGKRLTTQEKLLLADKIIDTFEEVVLSKYNIYIPNIEKEDPNVSDPTEVSNIYGTDYSELTYSILDILKNEGLLSKYDKR